jgi:hypothetical protein
MGAPAVSFRGRPDRQPAATLDEGPARAEKVSQHAEGEPITGASGHAGVQAGSSEPAAFPHYQLGWSRRAKDPAW